MAGIRDSLNNLFEAMNPFSKAFQDNRIQVTKDIESEYKKGVQGASESPDFSFLSNESVITSQIIFGDTFINKFDRIQKYREMARFPEISDAVDSVADEAIYENDRGQILTLKMSKAIPEELQEKIHNEFNFLMDDIFKIKERGWDLFRKWLVDGELYLEIVLNTNKNQIVGLQVLPPFSTIPLYEKNNIIGFTQMSESDIRKTTFDAYTTYTAYIPSKKTDFEPNQVLYVNYGDYGVNLYDTRGYFEPVMRIYNQLKNLEDSLIVYRLVRAPERRVWNVDVGRMPKGKAEEYIQKMIQKFKKRLLYNPSSGAIEASQNIQAMSEDFWFAKTEEGRGTTVELMAGGQQLGELDDVIYFLKKLYKTLKLPKSRWSEESSLFSGGKMSEITREEVKFTRFIERLQNRFKKIFIDALLLQLKLSNKISDEYIKYSHFDVSFSKGNVFAEYKEREVLNSKIEVLTSISDFIYEKEENEKGLFSKEYAMKYLFGMSEAEYEDNLKLLENEKNKPTAEEVADQEKKLTDKDITGGGDKPKGKAGEKSAITPTTKEEPEDEEMPAAEESPEETPKGTNDSIDYKSTHRKLLDEKVRMKEIQVTLSNRVNSKGLKVLQNINESNTVLASFNILTEGDRLVSTVLYNKENNTWGYLDSTAKMHDNLTYDKMLRALRADI